MSVLEYIVKRNGERVPFKLERIFVAINKAFLSENIADEAAVQNLTNEVAQRLQEAQMEGETLSVERVQDYVEDALMDNGYHRIAKKYILYREQHKLARQERTLTQIKEHTLQVKVSESETVVFDPKIIEDMLRNLTGDLMRVSIRELMDAIISQIYDRIPKHEIEALVMSAARERIEVHYEYAYLASRISLHGIYKSILGCPFNDRNLQASYQQKFAQYVQKGIDLEMLHPDLGLYDLGKLASALDPERDKLFFFLGTQILADRYLLRDRSMDRDIYELPQWFWMRVAMGLAMKETNREERAIEFYHVLSNMDLVSSTPTLFNSGTLFSQMSSCYLNTVDDSLEHIFKVYSDNAMLSKWAGGIGTDWTSIRATGSKIKGTNGLSQGVIPFIKIFNDVALAVNQGGKRKGAMCAYMEVWHLDIEQFLELKKNTGDERRRAHDINTACWIPDLFMKRVEEGGKWTLFCPSDAPELHDLYGKAFEDKYCEYESKNLPRARTLQAQDLWRKMLTMLYETGHPWITFKDAANVRNPQDHVGVIHSSNLCTEITLNTSKEETAVCNLASINMANMVTDGKLDEAKIERTLSAGIRMLDNVIDNNFYPTSEAKTANMRHRAIGLGLMGYQDALFKLKIAFDSNANLEFSDRSMEAISYYAIKASSELAKERGAYETFQNSKWERGLFPLDTMTLLEQQRGRKISVDRKSTLDWDALKAFVKAHGMRNSNTMAIAPTATIANIAGVYPCTEPVFKNIYMKENLSGNFVVVNKYLTDDLEKLGLWNKDIVAQIKLHNGSIQQIMDIPEVIRAKYKETFEIDSYWIIQAAARRSKWIDQSASTNVFINSKSGKAISDTYKMAWESGLKTTYYLRTIAASQIQKTSVETTMTTGTPQSTPLVEVASTNSGKAYLMGDSECEACQ
jgi:ribonucleoside-diphosphate reductase alpha chain